MGKLSVMMIVFCLMVGFSFVIPMFLNVSFRQDKLSPNKVETNLTYVMKERKTSFPFRGDPKCQHFFVQSVERESLPKWALTSFPGSGVTWLRQMIEGVTGIYTGSVYFGDPLPVKTQRGDDSDVDDPKCGCTIIDKDHEATIVGQFNNSNLASYFELLHRMGHAGIVHQQYDDRGVLLLRNPMDVVFTFRHWQTKGKVDHAPPEDFEGPEWEQVIDYVAYAWADHAIRWIEQIKNRTVIFYELLEQDEDTAQEELERLLNVLNFHPIDSDRMRCALAHRNRTDYKRENKTRMLLEPEQRLKLMKSIHRVQQSLRRREWPRLPIYLYDLHSRTGYL